MSLKTQKCSVSSNRLHRAKRALWHLPVGIFNVFAGYVSWPLALVFFGGFMVYEVNEDFTLKDGAYIDIYGYLIGLAIGIVALFVCEVAGLEWLEG